MYTQKEFEDQSNPVEIPIPERAPEPAKPDDLPGITAETNQS